MSMKTIEYKERRSVAGLARIIRILTEARGDFVSGTVLAEQLGISRPAIHGKFERLREDGFDVEGVRKRGYRFRTTPDFIHPALLSDEMDRLGSSLPVACYPVIDSTNSEAERRFASGQSGPFAIVSSCQTRGRGRLGRTWHSTSAENLYLSVLFEPNIPPQQLQHFTLWAGIRICRMLQHLVPDAPLQIKWPNDLLCKGRKFAGMLTEAKMDADSIRCIIFGIGLNVNSNPNDYPDSIRQVATSLHAMHGEALPLSRLAARVIAAVEKAYNGCIEGSINESLTEAWDPLSALRGKSVTAFVNGKAITGIAGGIDASGALLLKMADGSVETVRAGDVTLKK
jgi:BirA family biotin operon repressor/biotin-[acetyl-CoA-carboxylase] ligase